MPRFESGINLLDKKINIKWPKTKLNISQKDKKLMSFQKFLKTKHYL